jgi:hypothetical protein
LYNYVDDNTLSYVNNNYEKLIDILEKESSVLIDWFKFNCMQANPDKFQAIAVGNKTHAKKPVFKIDSAEITCDEVVKLLGIDIDYQLNFNYHIKNICRKASQQLNALKRIGCKALAWIFSNLEVLLLLQKCHAKGQKLKLDKMKV